MDNDTELIIPVDQLSPEALSGVIEQYIARDGIDSGHVEDSFEVKREAVRRMSTASGGSGGSIVNLSSTATALGSPNQWVHYAATKGAIDVFTRGLAHEVAEEGIRVNAVSPGLTLTDPAQADAIAARLEELRHEIPMGRAGSADEVAEAIYWLCSDAASYVTGAVLPAAGGR